MTTELLMKLPTLILGIGIPVGIGIAFTIAAVTTPLPENRGQKAQR